VALFLPPSVSVNRFVGGYKRVSDYTDLSDTETNDAENILYGPKGDIEQRLGSRKFLNEKLTESTTSSTSGEPITGHYFFKKTGETTGVHVVAAGDSVFNYNTATANAIVTGLSDNSNVFFQFVQIGDPRSAADDIVVFTNGTNVMHFWNGSASALAFSEITSASGIPIAKYILAHKNRIYAANLLDSTDVDSVVTVKLSSFGTDGAPDPHIFRDSFVVGGAGRQGPINGFKVLNNQIIIYTRNSIWKFSPGSGNTISTASLVEMQESVGLLAPFSLVDVGNFHIFLSDRGFFAFDGTTVTHISEKIDEEILNDSTLSQLALAKAVFDKKNNKYICYFAHDGNPQNNRAISFDLRLRAWHPPITGRNASYVSTFFDSNDSEKIVYGDYSGFLYEDGIGLNDGIETGFNGTTDSSTFNTLTDDDAAFSTANAGLAGLSVRIIDGPGEGQTRTILSNTSSVLTLEKNWSSLPTSATSLYTVGGINTFWTSKDYDFGNHDLVKLFRHVTVRARREGSAQMVLNYLIDFNSLAQAGTSTLSLFSDGFVWDVSRWDQATWGISTNFKSKVSLRSIGTQSTQGTHLKLRFSNERANDRFRITGFDIELTQAGKR